MIIRILTIKNIILFYGAIVLCDEKIPNIFFIE